MDGDEAEMARTGGLDQGNRVKMEDYLLAVDMQSDYVAAGKHMIMKH